MKFVITIPEGAEAVKVARRAQSLGAHMVEVRSDLPVEISAGEIESLPLPMLYSLRGGGMADLALLKAAELVDADIEHAAGNNVAIGPALMLSMHSEISRRADAVVSAFVDSGMEAVAVKYVEPAATEAERQIKRLERTRQLLLNHYAKVTVLVTGEHALNGRRRLAPENYLYYCALDAESRSADGQGILSEEIEFFQKGGGENRV